MKRIISAALLAAALILSVGCSQRGEPPPGQEYENPSSAPSDYQPPLAPVETEHDVVWWWDNYIGRSVYQMQGGMGDDLLGDQRIMLDLAISYAALDGKAAVSAASKGDNTYVTREVLDEYVNRYFGLENADGFFLENYKDDAGNIGTYAEGLLRVQRGPDPEDPAGGDWAFQVVDAQQVDESHVLVTVINKDDEYPEGWRNRILFLMAHAGGDQYRYEKVTVEYAFSDAEPPAGGTTQFTGISGRVDVATGLHPLQAQTVDGAIGDTLICAGYDYQPNVLTFQAIDAKTLEKAAHTRYVPLRKGEERHSTTVGDDAVYVLTNQRLFTLSPDFTSLEEEELPELLAAENSYTLTLSPNGAICGFVDDFGAKLYRMETGEVIPIAAHPSFDPNAEGRASMSNVTWGSPSWSADSRYAIFTCYGYESTEGALIHDLQTGETRELNQRFGWYSRQSGVVQGKMITPATNTGPSGDNQVLDLATGEVTTLHCDEERGEWIYLVMGDQLYLMQALEIPGIKDWETRTTALFQVDIETGEATPMEFTAKGAALRFCGASEHYAVFSYSRLSNMGDMGIVSVPLPA